MPRQSEIARNISYPQLSRDSIDAIIDALLFAQRNRAAGPMTRRYESAIGYLTGYYTKRWGLPTSLGGKQDSPPSSAAALAEFAAEVARLTPPAGR